MALREAHNCEKAAEISERWGRNVSTQRSGYHERRPWEVGAEEAEGEK